MDNEQKVVQDLSSSNKNDFQNATQSQNQEENQTSYQEKAMRTCKHCGAVMSDNSIFCPRCGTKQLQQNESLENDSQTTQSNARKALVIIGILVGIIILIILLFPRVESITLSKTSVVIRENECEQITYSVSPSSASNRTATWTSSDETVATVNSSGKIYAKSAGTCFITVKIGNKENTISVTVKHSPDLKNAYYTYCSSTWAKLGTDGSYLSIDTNPYDKDDYTEYSASQAIRKVNNYLGLPDSLITDMYHTTSLMGKQIETYDEIGVTVSWTFHPDNGLEVMYKLLDY